MAASRCAVCAGAMVVKLVEADPGNSALELRTYVCAECGHTEAEGLGAAPRMSEFGQSQRYSASRRYIRFQLRAASRREAPQTCRIPSGSTRDRVSWRKGWEQQRRRSRRIEYSEA